MSLTGRVFGAASLYFALTFGVGFVLGALRETFITPRLGPDASRLLELPLMVAVCWLTAVLVVRRTPGLPLPGWLGVGLFAFALLMVAEFLLGLFVMGMSPRAIFVSFTTPIGMISLAAQALLLVFPALAAARHRRDHG